MAIEKFTVEDFEAGLPHDKKKNNEAIFAHIGLHDGEHCWTYEMSRGQFRILVRSSIDRTGVSADTGEDSIRLMIERKKGGSWIPIGKGPDAYTTRIKGWQKRLKEKVITVHKKIAEIRYTVQDTEMVYFCSKGANIGRPFSKSVETGKFVRWLDV